MAEQQADGSAEQQQQRVRTVRQLDSLIEQRIREAAERGVFDNLASKGKPVQLDLKDAIDHEAWFVNRTMKSLGAAPAWMELGKEIDAAEARFRWMREDFARWIAETRAELTPLPRRERDARRPAIELRFEDRFGRYSRLAEELRRLIERFNHETPVRVLEKPGLWVAHEQRRLRAPYAALCEDLGWGEPAAEPSAPVAPTPDEAPSAPAADETPAGHRLLGLWRKAVGRSTGPGTRGRG